MASPSGGTASPGREPAARFVRTLFDENSADLLRYVRRISPEDPGRAEDLVQETFLRAWRHRDGLSAHGSARAWLFRVARNLAVDWHRRQAVRLGESEALGEDSARMTDPLAEDSLEAVLLRTDLVEALRTLSAAHREALVHLHLFDRTQWETASLLDVPLGTVKSRHHTAVRALRRALDQRGINGH
ncbi:hypothetical protein CcI49_05310 [Frankia sp. CcI49]|uniref:sigma-70 family RNA polymerase sigma factor n=1 Tax=unclassified Frankia TaxID=2632575 RepID=UPI0006CA174A|nr:MULTISPECIES: sigma-70 family RNA polymerase sigma factor [unclassified Frankia]KPM54199.1 hypothetical protein ACG83_19550 [Frankia sp. R43]ONH61627.1 hypothetical protein CcI49_05310 [Frankia sp. CcI49]